MVCVEADGRIALVNAQAERLFGYHRDELIGKPVEMLVPDEARTFHARHRDDYVAGPRPPARPMGAGLQLAGRRRDGTTFPADISLSAIPTSQGPLITAAVRDVTDRIEAQAEAERLRADAERGRLEAQRSQAQRMESLGQLAGGVAHDFNNLLGVISTYATFAREEAGKDPPEVQWEAVCADLVQVEAAAERAAGLTRQLLAFARRDVIQPRVLNLNDLVTEVWHLLHGTLGEHIGLADDLSADLSSVLADPGQIGQVLVNLAVNARDAMPGGGQLTIQTANVQVDDSYAAPRADLRSGWHVSVKVSDTGTGIPGDIMSRVFEPFFTTKSHGEGTGLGLATSYGIITQAGGTIRICSEPGLGTTVTVLLPATGQAAPAQPPPPAKPGGGTGQVVLIVEDEPALREVARRILDRNGYHVLTAASGLAAIDLVTNRPGRIDLLLTDVIMPQMMGEEVAQRIRARQPGIRVLYMSGYTQGPLSAQGVLEPGVNLIEKPFSEPSLLATINNILTRPAG
jgi:PAS domain S-box-containing protein